MDRKEVLELLKKHYGFDAITQLKYSDNNPVLLKDLGGDITTVSLKEYDEYVIIDGVKLALLPF